MKLHIGGEQAREGWKILNAQDGPHVDFVGNCVDLSRFPDGSVEEIYASHVFEHLSYTDELPQALRECYRVLLPEGELKLSVPDLSVLCEMFLDEAMTAEQRLELMRVMFGGQLDPYDFHKTGLTEEIMHFFLGHAGFTRAARVEEFDLFEDTSRLRLGERLISLNLSVRK